ncbi:MAG TPA: phage tail length tape measure family protein, partial [Woeseiaceae bacterium]|nr:phage tail length tape measure family protein [Woeseiaceae bacterium]
MGSNSDDIKVRIAGDLADINRALSDLKKQTKSAGVAAGKTRSDWNKLGKGLENVRRQVKGLVGAYVSFRAISATIRSVITNTVEQERVTAQLEARLKSTGSAAGLTAEELGVMADGFEEVTNFSDQAVTGLQGLLLTFTQIKGDVFQDATAAILDMSTALGTDLKASAIQVGKALNDPVVGASALREVGVSLTAQQIALVRSLVETGDVVGAQRVILNELAVEFGGAAAAARDTFGGALASLKNAASDLTEGGGGNLEDAKDSINDLTELLRDPNTVAAFGAITKAIIKLTEVTVKAVTAFTNFGTKLGETVAGALGAGVPIDEAKEKIAELQKQIDGLSGGLFDSPRVVAKLRAEQAELQKLVDLNEELRRGQEFGQNARRSRSTAGGQEVVDVTLDGRPALRSLQAQLSASGVLLKDELKRLGDALDRDFEDNLVRFSDYFKRRADLETQSIDQQLQSQRTVLALLDEEIRLIAGRGESTVEAEEKRGKLVAEITVLERQRADVAATATRNQAAAEKGLADQLAEVRLRLQEIQGDSVGARTAQLENEFRELLQRLQAEGDAEGEALVRRLIDVELAKSQLAQFETEYQRSLTNLSREEQRVQALIDTGTISEREGRLRIIELHQATATEVAALIPLMQALAEATGDPEAIERVKDMHLQFETLASVADRTGKQIRDSLQDASEGAFASFLSGAQDARSAWDSFTDNIRQKAAELVSEKIFDKLFDSFKTDGDGGGGFLSTVGSFLAGLFHTGGIAGDASSSR